MRGDVYSRVCMRGRVLVTWRRGRTRRLFERDFDRLFGVGSLLWFWIPLSSSREGCSGCHSSGRGGGG